MALRVTNKNDIPKGAVELTRSDAINYQWTQIINWHNQWDVWPFKWGLAGMGLMAASNGAYINLHFRKKLKLQRHGFVSTILPLTAAPAMFSSAMHIMFITQNIFAMDTKCPVCLLTEASIIQFGCSIVYPIIMAPIANFSYASRHATYRVPWIYDFRGNIKCWWEFVRPVGHKLLIMGCVQAALAAFLTYTEIHYLHKFHQILLAQEEPKEFDNSP